MINTIIFDLDDTLYKEKDFVFGAFKQIAFRLSKCYGMDFNKLNNDILEIFYQHGRGMVFNQLFEKYHIEEDIQHIVEEYRQAKAEVMLYEDAEWALVTLKEKGYHLAIITDGDSIAQHNKISLLNLREYVDKIIVTYDLGIEYCKPHIRAYEQTLQHFRIQPKEAIYVGDNPNKDFIGAKNLGIHTVRIIREYGDHMQTKLSQQYEADYEIHTLTKLEEVIHTINNE